MTAPTGELEAAFRAGAPEPARTWLAAAREQVAADRGRLPVLFPAAGRGCGRGTLPDGRRVDDSARVLLLAGLPWPATGPLAELYRWGDADEKRAVLLALDHLDLEHLDPLDDGVLPLVEDALRTSDTRLIAAALGDYAAGHLSDSAYRHAVLKCVFCDIPLTAVAGLAGRADPELARMLADYTRERVAAGRAVPADVWPVLARFPAAVADAGLPAELAAADPARAAAARQALAAYELARHDGPAVPDPHRSR